MKIDLTASDAAEIYDALETKIETVKNFHYASDIEEIENEAWVTHLRTIMTKIGPDGVNLL